MCPQTIVGFRDSCTMGKLPCGKIFLQNKGRCFWYSRKLHFYHKSHFAFSSVICGPPFLCESPQSFLALNFLCKSNWRYLRNVHVIRWVGLDSLEFNQMKQMITLLFLFNIINPLTHFSLALWKPCLRVP